MTGRLGQRPLPFPTPKGSRPVCRRELEFLSWIATCNSRPIGDAGSDPVDRASDQHHVTAGLACPISRSMDNGSAADRRQLSIAEIDDREPCNAAVDLARAYGEMGKLLMAAEYFEAAEPCYLHAQALEPDEMRWPYYLGHVYMAKAEPEKSMASFERALRLRPSDVATLVWLGNLHLEQGQPELAEPLFTQALSTSTAHGCSALRSRPGGPRETRVRPGSRSVRAGAVGRSTRIDRPLSARARVSRAGRHGKGRSAPASAGRRGGWSAGSVDGGAARTAARRRGRGEPRYSRVEQRRLPGGGGPFPQGRGAGAGQPVDSAQAGNGIVADGRYSRRVEQFEETVRRSPGFPQAHYSLGVLLAASGRPRRRSSTSRPLFDTSPTMSRHGCDWRKCCARPDAPLRR